MRTCVLLIIRVYDHRRAFRRYNIDCQWVDISDLQHGEYTLRVAVNPEFKVPEMSYENNAAQCDLYYFETYARVMNCRLERP